MTTDPKKDPRVLRAAAAHPQPLLFATISGAHLYGFASADSDFDLRGAHVLPLTEVVGLDTGPETIERESIVDGAEIDLVTHEVAKFMRLMLRPNGYVLEQLLSPLVVQTTPAHEELVRLAPQCLTRFHAHHYLGFAETQWRLFEKESPPRVKPLLYVYRVLLTGIHLMRTGRVIANLPELNQDERLTFLEDLIQRKTGGTEKQTLASADLEFHRGEFARLTGLLGRERDRSALPDAPTARPAMHDLLLRIRIADPR